MSSEQSGTPPRHQTSAAAADDGGGNAAIGTEGAQQPSPPAAEGPAAAPFEETAIDDGDTEAAATAPAAAAAPDGAPLSVGSVGREDAGRAEGATDDGATPEESEGGGGGGGVDKTVKAEPGDGAAPKSSEETLKELKINQARHLAAVQAAMSPAPKGRRLPTQKDRPAKASSGSSSSSAKHKIKKERGHHGGGGRSPKTPRGHKSSSHAHAAPSTPTPQEAHMSSWNDFLYQLLVYRAERGDCMVPKTFGGGLAGSLAYWVKKQRQLYRKKRAAEGLGSVRIEDGNGNGDDDDGDGDCDGVGDNKESSAASKEPNSKVTPNSGNNNNNGREPTSDGAAYITDEQIMVLESIGFDFLWEGGKPRNEALDARWDAKLEELKQFKEVHGHCNVSQNSKEHDKLGRWVKANREKYNTKQLAQNRIDRLNEIGFCWRAQRGGPALGWDAQFEELVEYIASHGHANVPQSYKGQRALGRWVMRQRVHYAERSRGGKNALTEERIQKLEGVGFLWVGLGAQKIQKRKAEAAMRESAAVRATDAGAAAEYAAMMATAEGSGGGGGGGGVVAAVQPQPMVVGGDAGFPEEEGRAAAAALASAAATSVGAEGMVGTTPPVPYDIEQDIRATAAQAAVAHQGNAMMAMQQQQAQGGGGGAAAAVMAMQQPAPAAGGGAMMSMQQPSPTNGGGGTAMAIDYGGYAPRPQGHSV